MGMKPPMIQKRDRRINPAASLKDPPARRNPVLEPVLTGAQAI